METYLDRLEKLLKNHDWYYMYSDDSRAYESGANERKEIHLEMEYLGKIGKKDEADELFDKYQPIYPEVTD